MPFNIFTWLFTDPITAGGPNSDGSEVFHYFWPYLIVCGVGLLIWFYYWVEGRKRFLKSDKSLKDQLPKDKPFVKGNKPLKDMLDLYLNWLAVICFIGIPIDLTRVVLDGYFFAWRFWRYLWLVALLVWAVLWIIYLVRTLPGEGVTFQYVLGRRASEHKAKKAEDVEKSKRKAEKGKKKDRKKQRELARR